MSKVMRTAFTEGQQKQVNDGYGVPFETVQKSLAKQQQPPKQDLNPWYQAPQDQKPWKYDPSKPLHDGRKNGNGEWYTKHGDQFRRNWSYTQGTRYGPTRSYGWNPVNTDEMNPHTGESREQTSWGSTYKPMSGDAFNDYFRNYLLNIGG